MWAEPQFGRDVGGGGRQPSSRAMSKGGCLDALERITMSRGASHYSISQFIYQVFHQSGVKRSQFIAALGYHNTTGGLRSLDQWLDSGEGDPLLIERLVQVYNVDPATVRLALSETDAQHQAEYEEAVRRHDHWSREHFRQYVFVETPSGVVQSSFTVAAIVAPALKTISLPEGFATKPESTQTQDVAELIRAHFDERGGKLPLFGPIIGYRFVSAYDQSIRFDVAGNVIQRVAGHFVGPGGSIHIGRTTVPPMLLLHMFGGLQ
jgi:hypothetical protein